MANSGHPPNPDLGIDTSTVFPWDYLIDYPVASS